MTSYKIVIKVFAANVLRVFTPTKMNGGNTEVYSTKSTWLRLMSVLVT